MSTALIRTTWYGVIYSDFCPTNFLLWYHLRIIQIVHRITGSGSAMMAWSQGGWRSSKKLRRFALLLWLCRQLWPLAHACHARQTPLISSARARADARSAYVLTSCSSPTMRWSTLRLGKGRHSATWSTWATKIAGEKKSSSRPSKVRHCLVAETDDEDEDDDRLITWWYRDVSWIYHVCITHISSAYHISAACACTCMHMIIPYHDIVSRSVSCIYHTVSYIYHVQYHAHIIHISCVYHNMVSCPVSQHDMVSHPDTVSRCDTTSSSDTRTECDTRTKKLSDKNRYISRRIMQCVSVPWASSVSCIYHVQYHADIMPYHDNVSRSVSCIYRVCITKWYHVPYHVVIPYHILIRYHVVIRRAPLYHVWIYFMIRTFFDIRDILWYIYDISHDMISVQTNKTNSTDKPVPGPNQTLECSVQH